MKNAIARAGILFSWWVIDTGRKVVALGEKMEAFVDNKVQEAGVDFDEMIYPIVEPHIAK